MIEIITHLNFNNIIQFIIFATIGGSLGNLLSIYVDNKSKDISIIKEEITISKIVLGTIKIDFGITIWSALFIKIALIWDSISSFS